jgi:hypothetical protein
VCFELIGASLLECRPFQLYGDLMVVVWWDGGQAESKQREPGGRDERRNESETASLSPLFSALLLSVAFHCDIRTRCGGTVAYLEKKKQGNKEETGRKGRERDSWP